jgi:hypothetical protein
MGRPIHTSSPENNKKVELPYRLQYTTEGAGPSDSARAIVHVQEMRMMIPSIHCVFVNPSIRGSRGNFIRLNNEELMDIFETAKQYLVEASVNPVVPRMIIALRNDWEGEFEIHMFPARTD